MGASNDVPPSKCAVSATTADTRLMSISSDFLYYLRQGRRVCDTPRLFISWFVSMITQKL